MIPEQLRRSGVAQFLLIHVVAIASPLLLIVGAGPWSPSLQGGLQSIVSVAFVLTSVMILTEALISIRRRSGPRLHGSSGPPRDLTIILVAYLPNEQEVVLPSIAAILERLDHPADRLQLILAYNTPVDLPIEPELHAMASRHQSLEVLRVAGSSSKAENLVAAIQHARGSVTAIIDSDHQLHPEAATRALRWFDEGYDVVQGRCVIRNPKESLLARIVSIEFEQIYGLAHSGRSLLMDTAIFGGANGWWRTDVLRELGFDASMLTEDIDVSMRAMLTGHRIVHDRSVLSTELAPTSWGAWWKQRTRWAQGWLQVTMRHQRAVLRAPHLSWPLKGYWTILLTWRELFPVIALQVFTLIASDLLLRGELRIQFDPLVALSIGLTVGSGVVAAWATWRLATDHTRGAQRWWRFALFGFGAPLYTVLRNTVALVAVAREVLGDRRWVVTARTATATTATTLAVGIAVALGSSALVPSTADAANEAATTPPTTPARKTLLAVARVQPPVAPKRPPNVDPGLPIRSLPIVGPSDQPRTLDSISTRVNYAVAVPGSWSAVRGLLTLQLRGGPRLGAASRLVVSVDGTIVRTTKIRPGAQTLSIPVPAMNVRGHGIDVDIASRLTTTSSNCPPAGDPDATMQLLPGSDLQLQARVSTALTIADLPGALVNALGTGPAQVLVRFGSKPTPSAITAAGIAAGAIALERGNPGARVRLAEAGERATVLLDDRPGPSRLRVSLRDGRPTLTISGNGQALVAAALAIGTPETQRVRKAVMSRPRGRLTARRPLPPTLSLAGATSDEAGKAEATVSFELPGRYEVRRAARLRFGGSVESPGGARVSVSINDRRLSSRISTAPGIPLRIDTVLAGRGPGYLRGDLRPGTNRLTVSATAVGRTRVCASGQPMRTAIEPTGTIDLVPKPRALRNGSLATWPYPLDASPSWQGSDVILPPRPSGADLGAVIAVLAESRRLDGEPALPRIRFGGTPDPGRPALVLARPSEVPDAIAREIDGGAAAGTLAFVPSGRGVVLAVGERALGPLTAGVTPESRGALTIDTVNGASVVRTPDTRVVASATTPLPGQVRWPLIILGLSLAAVFLLALRQAQRRRAGGGA